GTVRMSLPMHQILQTQFEIVRNMSLIVIFIGLIALLITLGLMRRILAPIHLLAKGTTRVANGEYGGQVPVYSKDELGALAESFNRMSKALSETTVSKDFLGRILSHMIDPLLVVTATGTIQMVNDATLDLLGYSSEELQGKPLQFLIP